jgi:DNA-binding phage protein
MKRYKGGHPLAMQTIALIKRERASVTDFERRGVVCTSMITRWKVDMNPSLNSICRVLDAMGYELAIVKKTTEPKR